MQTQETSAAGPSVSLQEQAEAAVGLLSRYGLDAEAYAALQLAAESSLLKSQARHLDALEVTGIAGVPDALHALAAELAAIEDLSAGVGPP